MSKAYVLASKAIIALVSFYYRSKDATALSSVLNQFVRPVKMQFAQMNLGLVAVLMSV